MRFRFTFFILTFLLFSKNVMAQTPGWESVGTSPACGSMDLDGSGNVYVLNSNAVYKYASGSWTNLGNPYINYTGANPIFYKNLSVSASGTPYVTYHFESAATLPPSHIRSYLSYYDGVSWNTQGGTDMGADVETHYPVYDAVTGIASVTTVPSPSCTLKVKKATPSWVTTSNIPVSSSTNTYTSIGHDASGHAFLVYYESSALKVIKIASDGSYTTVGASIPTTSFCSGCHGWSLPFCVSPSGIPYVGYLSKISETQYDFIAYLYNGTSWQAIQTYSITDPSNINVQSYTMAVSATGLVFVGYSVSGSSSPYGKIVYYDGASWAEVGTQNFSSVSSIKVSSGNVLYKDGCEKYDVSGLAVVTDNKLAEADQKFIVFADESGIVIAAQDGNGVAYIYDQLGKLLAEEKVGLNARLTIPLQKSGVYIVKMQSETGSLMTQKVMFVK
jgi:hypothetical protein